MTDQVNEQPEDKAQEPEPGFEIIADEPLTQSEAVDRAEATESQRVDYARDQVVDEHVDAVVDPEHVEEVLELARGAAAMGGEDTQHVDRATAEALIEKTLHMSDYADPERLAARVAEAEARMAAEQAARSVTVEQFLQMVDGHVAVVDGTAELRSGFGTSMALQAAIKAAQDKTAELIILQAREAVMLQMLSTFTLTPKPVKETQTND